MTTQTEALKLVNALNELLESFEKDGRFCKSSSIRNELYDRLKQTLEESKEALAQHIEQEPVAVVEELPTGEGNPPFKFADLRNVPTGAKLYTTTTPQRKPMAQPEQEPVAHVCVFPLRGDEFFPQTRIEWKNGRPVAGPLYTTPPQRTWVGLTDAEKYALSNDVAQRGVPVFEAICEAEAKLKEKNV